MPTLPGNLVVLLVIATTTRLAHGASWDVDARVEVVEDGVFYRCEAGLGLLDKVLHLPRQEREWLLPEEREAVREVLAREIGGVVAFAINGVLVEAQLKSLRFPSEEEGSPAGKLARKGTRVVFEVLHRSATPPRAVSLSWGLLPERYFAGQEVDELVALLPSRERSALVEVVAGSDTIAKLEFDRQNYEFSWTWSGERLREAAALEDPPPNKAGPWRERLVLLGLIAVLVLLHSYRKSRR